jgi:hypothetical protein
MEYTIEKCPNIRVIVETPSRSIWLIYLLIVNMYTYLITRSSLKSYKNTLAYNFLPLLIFFLLQDLIHLLQPMPPNLFFHDTFKAYHYALSWLSRHQLKRTNWSQQDLSTQ